MLKRKKLYREKHNFKVIEVLEEVYPETGQKLIRPEIKYGKAIFFVVLVLACVAVLSFALLKIIAPYEWYRAIDMPWWLQYLLVYLTGVVLSVILFSKEILIFIIRLYQRYGPYDIRSRCLYIPNCSEYMILAIKKYGLIRGVIKGVKRFQSCYGPNGGEDYP